MLLWIRDGYGVHAVYGSEIGNDRIDMDLSCRRLDAQSVSDPFDRLPFCEQLKNRQFALRNPLCGAIGPLRRCGRSRIHLAARELCRRSHWSGEYP